MRIGILGLGLIGGSLAGALTASGYEVTGYDVDATAQGIARERRLVADVLPLDKILSSSDVVVLAMPLGAIIDSIQPVAESMKPDAILTDVGSVKRPVINAMNSLRRGPRCVGGHPMAGKATKGTAEADPELFAGAPYALVRSNRCDDDAVATVTRLVSSIRSVPHEMDAVKHDREVASTSHLPQVLSSALSLTLADEDSVMKGPGLAGMLRLAHSDEHLWLEILEHNADFVLDALARHATEISTFASSLERRDGDQLLKLLTRARESAG